MQPTHSNSCLMNVNRWRVSILAWDKTDEKVSSYINRFLEKCLTLIPEKYSIANPCIINTELNSGNFLIGEGKENSYVIDWEKALIGECEQDLAHFLAPTTTFLEN